MIHALYLGVMIGGFWLTGVAAAAGLELGQIVPAFTIISGDGQSLSLSDLKSRAVVLIYETKDVIEQNRPLKTSLTTLFQHSLTVKTGCVILPVINCSAAYWPVTRIWQNQLLAHSKTEQITIYGDWDGKMAAAYGFTNGVSHVLIIDNTGTVQYRRDGKLEAAEIDTVSSLLEKLTARGSAKP